MGCADRLDKTAMTLDRKSIYVAFLAFQFFLLTAPTGHAREQSYCAIVGDLAESVMRARQTGVPMSKAMEIGAQQSEDAKNLIEMFALQAYHQTRFSTEPLRHDAVVDFRNNIELECYQATN